MIEMRWFTPYVPPGWHPIRRLQYRVDPSNGLGQWTEWQDVPEVQGERDAADGLPKEGK